jgi:hypothetical protein
MALEQELATYKSKLPELHDDQGKFALVRGDALVGVYGTYDDALNAGYEKFWAESIPRERDTGCGIRAVHLAPGCTRMPSFTLRLTASGWR